MLSQSVSQAINDFSMLIAMSKANVPFLLSIIGCMWVLQLLNMILGYRLNVLGIYPRNPLGLVGIFCSPFLHGNFNHLFFNTIPLFIFANFMLLMGLQVFYCSSIVIIILSGLGVWLFGRKALHIGASSVIMGYWGYLIANAFYQPAAMSIIFAIVSVYYFGGLIFALLPGKAGVSVEGHIFGFIAGIAATYLCPMILIS